MHAYIQIEEAILALRTAVRMNPGNQVKHNNIWIHNTAYKYSTLFICDHTHTCTHTSTHTHTHTRAHIHAKTHSNTHRSYTSKQYLLTHSKYVWNACRKRQRETTQNTSLLIHVKYDLEIVFHQCTQTHTETHTRTLSHRYTNVHTYARTISRWRPKHISTYKTTRSLSPSLIHPHTHSLSLSLFLSLAHTHRFVNAHTHSLSLIRPCTQTHIPTHTHTLSLCPYLIYPCTDTHSLIHAHILLPLSLIDPRTRARTHIHTNQQIASQALLMQLEHYTCDVLFNYESKYGRLRKLVKKALDQAESGGGTRSAVWTPSQVYICLRCSHIQTPLIGYMCLV